MSLAIGPSKGKITYIYAGVNSSPADIAKGNNHHLRTLAIEQSKARSSVGTKTPDARIAQVSKSAFFANPDSEVYQRLLRVTGPVGAAATAMGKEPQLTVFDASGATPKIKGSLELSRDAEDMDIFQTGEGEFQVAYCHKHELFITKIGKENSAPESVFTMPDDHGERPTFRSIRYLSSEFILAAANLSSRSGVILLGLRLPTPKHPQARLGKTIRIPGQISATALAVTCLSPPSPGIVSTGDSQFAIAVATSDCAIHLYTITRQPGASLAMLIDLHPLTVLKNVHGNGNITGLDFSHFIAPKTHIRPQSIKLASISLQKTVAVHTIPLKRYTDTAPRNKNGPPRPTRYVMDLEAQKRSAKPLLVQMSLIVLVMAILGQGLMEVYGGSRPILHINKFIPSWHGSLRSFDPPPPGLTNNAFLSNLAGHIKPTGKQSVVMFETDQPHDAEAADGQLAKKINVDIHDEEVHYDAKTWGDLHPAQQAAWKQKLKDTGAWTQHMGETVFQGVLFGEIAGVVAQAVGG